MENDNIGSRVRRIAASSAGFLTVAALVTATVYPSVTFSQATVATPNQAYASFKEREDNYFYNVGILTDKLELTCTSGTKTYDAELCGNYIEELTKFLREYNSPKKTEPAIPSSPPYSGCNDCHISN